MFNLYTPEFLEASAKNNIHYSSETQQKHQVAFTQNKGDLKVHKKTDANDHSLLNINGQLAVVGEKLGQGSFGVVKSGMLAPAGEFVAIKRVFFDPTCDTDAETIRERKLLREDFEAEIEVLKATGDYKGHGKRMSRYGEKGYILTTYHSGTDLRYFNFNAFTLEHVLKIMLGILSKLRVLHEHNPPYLHNDLNDGNVKIDFKNNEVLAVELIDFGASRQRGQPSTTFSMDYVMPEMNGVRNSKMPRTFAMDIYDFGHVAHSAFVRIKDVKSHPNAEGLRSIIIKCLSTDPMLRPTIAELEEQINQLMPKMPVEPVAEPSRPEAAQAVALKPEESSTHQDDSACLSEESSSVKNTGNNRRKVGCCAIL